MSSPAFSPRAFHARRLPVLGGLLRLLRGNGLGAAAFSGVGTPLPVLVPGDPAIARQLYRGSFRLAGQTRECRPADVFAMPPPSSAWWDELTAFEWLKHFDAAGLALYRAFARTLLITFAKQRAATSFTADCRRLTALARHAGFLLSGASESVARDILKIAAAEVRHLASQRPRRAADQLRQALALLSAGLAFRGASSLRGAALSRCAALASIMILADGGPADRNPQTLLNLLAELLPLRGGLEAQRVPIPPALAAAIARGLEGLALLSHASGGLAVFQGVDDTAQARIAAVLTPRAELLPTVWHGKHSGFGHMRQGSASVIIDCGPPAQCHSPLAFEFSDGGQRIVGNCGLPIHPSHSWRAAACSAAAHTALHIEAEDVAGAPAFLARRGAPRQLAAELVETPHGILFKGRNELAAASFGIAHRRDLFLAAKGHDLRGEDSFMRAEGHAGDWPDAGFVIRFHLAPGLRANVDRSGSSVTLVLPDRAVWQMTARGGELHLEDSIFLATGGSPQPCKQIVIRGRVGRPDRVVWAFKKLAATEMLPRRSL